MINFESDAFKNDTLINGNCYHAKLEDNFEIYLMDVIACKNDKSRGENAVEHGIKEVWVVHDDWTKRCLTSNCKESQDMTHVVDDLFVVVATTGEIDKLDNGITQLLLNYISKDE